MRRLPLAKKCESFIYGGVAKKITHKTGKPTRDAFLSIPLTRGQKRAVIRAADKLGLDAASYARMRILAETPYDPEKDEDLGR